MKMAAMLLMTGALLVFFSRLFKKRALKNGEIHDGEAKKYLATNGTGIALGGLGLIAVAMNLWGSNSAYLVLGIAAVMVMYGAAVIYIAFSSSEKRAEFVTASRGK